ncbi:MalY/PatB family protein [Marinomonas polaris]|uniref:cysteine-S-conjugate beta-lyase n=1 Tax=Marinomonas polaris DSM 16579 TaxID=1122206 RepID=A0A1M5IN37_9GAMM|nr:PatB family C-S lyase [Marinomonas polaris]SHG29645.1 cystathione beta-lyase [Marinomonas polaris DSM 16579]|tara:strand:+ start:205 stop:1359 length:1155 start_codon:yes stop_codon:yes gene_type:complete
MDVSFSVFDTLIDRSNMSSDKWSKYPGSVIPMWIADMDFDSPDCIKKALNQRVNEGVYGYTHTPKALVKAIKSHLSTRYDWDVSGAHLVHLPGLVCALHLSVRVFSNEGDGIVVPGPVYYHLTKAPLASGRDLLNVDIVIQNGRWVPDMAQFEVACANPKSKMILLCNPHNPGGTVYTKEELLSIHALAEKYDLVVVSDEIHCDLILDDLPHVPFASLNDDAANRTITLMAPSKTFNIAGLGYAFAVIENAKLRQAFNQERAGLIPSPNMLSLAATIAAYEEGQEWHKELLVYLKSNRDLLAKRIAATPLEMVHLEATYLAWIDVSALSLDNPYQFFVDAGVGVSDGKDFGNPNYVRLNFGCPQFILDQAMTRIEEALIKHKFM